MTLEARTPLSTRRKVSPPNERPGGPGSASRGPGNHTVQHDALRFSTIRLRCSCCSRPNSTRHWWPLRSCWGRRRHRWRSAAACTSLPASARAEQDRSWSLFRRKSSTTMPFRCSIPTITKRRGSSLRRSCAAIPRPTMRSTGWQCWMRLPARSRNAWIIWARAIEGNPAIACRHARIPTSNPCRTIRGLRNCSIRKRRSRKPRSPAVTGDWVQRDTAQCPIATSILMPSPKESI
jgi:hypothetical protein